MDGIYTGDTAWVLVATALVLVMTQGGIELAGRSGAYKVDLLPRVQVNIALSDHNLEVAIETICRAAHTGSVGNGLIFVSPVEDVIRISMGERGRAALQYPHDIDERAR